MSTYGLTPKPGQGQKGSQLIGLTLRRGQQRCLSHEKAYRWWYRMSWQGVQQVTATSCSKHKQTSRPPHSRGANQLRTLFDKIPVFYIFHSTRYDLITTIQANKCTQLYQCCNILTLTTNSIRVRVSSLTSPSSGSIRGYKNRPSGTTWRVFGGSTYKTPECTGRSLYTFCSAPWWRDSEYPNTYMWQFVVIVTVLWH